MLKYLGAYRGVYLLERDGRLSMQYNDGGFQETWREEQIPQAEADQVVAGGRDEYDMVFRRTSENIPPGVKPIWETNPVEYLEWHRDHDPSPYSEEAAAALVKLRAG